MKQAYIAEVLFRHRTAAGEVLTVTLAQDVTDEIRDGATPEHLVDRIYWNQIVGRFADIEILAGDVVVRRAK